MNRTHALITTPHHNRNQPMAIYSVNLPNVPLLYLAPDDAESKHFLASQTY